MYGPIECCNVVTEALAFAMQENAYTTFIEISLVRHVIEFCRPCVGHKHCHVLHQLAETAFLKCHIYTLVHAPTACRPWTDYIAFQYHISKVNVQIV